METYQSFEAFNTDAYTNSYPVMAGGRMNDGSPHFIVNRHEGDKWIPNQPTVLSIILKDNIQINGNSYYNFWVFTVTVESANNTYFINGQEYCCTAPSGITPGTKWTIACNPSYPPETLENDMPNCGSSDWSKQIPTPQCCPEQYWTMVQATSDGKIQVKVGTGFDPSSGSVYTTTFRYGSSQDSGWYMLGGAAQSRYFAGYDNFCCLAAGTSKQCTSTTDAPDCAGTMTQFCAENAASDPLVCTCWNSVIAQPSSFCYDANCGPDSNRLIYKPPATSFSACEQICEQASKYYWEMTRDEQKKYDANCGKMIAPWIGDWPHSDRNAVWAVRWTGITSSTIAFGIALESPNKVVTTLLDPVNQRILISGSDCTVDPKGKLSCGGKNLVIKSIPYVPPSTGTLILRIAPPVSGVGFPGAMMAYPQEFDDPSTQAATLSWPTLGWTTSTPYEAVPVTLPPGTEWGTFDAYQLCQKGWVDWNIWGCASATPSGPIKLGPPLGSSGGGGGTGTGGGGPTSNNANPVYLILGAMVAITVLVLFILWRTRK